MGRNRRSGIDHSPGMFGLVLIVLVGKLANVGYRAQGPRPQPVRRFLARRAMAGIVAIGWLVDRLSGHAVSDTGDSVVATNRPVLTR